MNLGFGRRLGLAILIFAVGLHLIGWGILYSGTAGPSNPVWPMISTLFAFEKWVLFALFYLFILGSIVAILVQIVRRAPSQAPEPSDSTAPHATPVRREWSSQLKPSVSPSISCETPRAPAAQAGVEGTPLPATLQKLRLSEPSRPPTAKALREQALKQIIGG